METLKELTGYPSKDKPWLNYYTDKEINATLPPNTIYEYLWNSNKNHLNDIAINSSLEFNWHIIKYI